MNTTKSSTSESPENHGQLRVLPVSPETLAGIEPGLQPEIQRRLGRGAKLVGLFLIAACVGGELNPDAPDGEAIHAHGGHENKRQHMLVHEHRRAASGDDEGDTGLDGKKTFNWLMRIDEKISSVRRLLENRVPPPEPTEGEAVRVFSLLKTLDTGGRVRKAPLPHVFRLLVLEGLSQKAAAGKCRCTPALITYRVRELERRLALPVARMRALASRLGELSRVEDSRARKIYRGGLEDEGTG